MSSLYGKGLIDEEAGFYRMDVFCNDRVGCAGHPLLDTSIWLPEYFVGRSRVFNVAVGYEYTVSSRFSLAGSIRTDNSYYDSTLKDAVGIKTELSSWDIYHFSLGGIFTKGRNQLTIGILFSTGKDDKRSQEGNLEQPSEDNYKQGSTKIVKSTYHSFGIMLGYAFSFKKF